jgi:hypothetical protein
MGIYSLDFIIILLFLAAASRNGTMIAAWKIAARRRRLHPPYRYAGDPVDVLVDQGPRRNRRAEPGAERILAAESRRKKKTAILWWI